MRTRLNLFAVVSIVTMCQGLAGAGPLREGQVQIELRPQFIARHPEVRLGDIAILHTTDLSTIQRLSALPLGKAPALGGEAVVGRELVARWVRSQLGIGPDQVLWSGAQKTHVHSIPQDFPAARIEQAAKVALRDWLDKRASRHRIDAFPLAADVRLPAGPVDLKARPQALHAEPRPRMTVWMDVHVDGRFVRTVPISFAVEAYRETWVAPAALAGGIVLRAGMVEAREVEITGRIDSAALMPPQLNQALGHWRTTKALKEGEPVTTRNTAPAPAVARGDWVALHLTAGPVELEGRAQALQDGKLGQLMKVQPANGASPVQVRVVAPGRVEATL